MMRTKDKRRSSPNTFRNNKALSHFLGLPLGRLSSHVRTEVVLTKLKERGLSLLDKK